MLRFRALASGSSGNSFLLQTTSANVLIDAGLPRPKLEKYLAAEGLHPTSLAAILISHEHRDHCVSARDLADAYQIPILANIDVLRAAGLHDCPSAGVLDVGRPMCLGDVHITSFPVSHDAVRPVGFQLRVDGRHITIATDLGDPTGEMLDAVTAGDLVVLEANHDREMLVRGKYPHYLKRRVGGPRGHLSNDQAAQVLTTRIKQDTVDVWLAHLSKENNTPALALKTVRRALAQVGLGNLGVGVLHRDRPSLRWDGVPRPRQLSLFPSLEPA